MFKFELNGVTINDQPDGWEGITSSIKRDSLSGGLYFESEINLISYGGQDLFIALKSLWENDPFGRSNFKIYQKSTNVGYLLIQSGVVFHSDMKLSMVNNSIQFKVEDDNWFSKIKANQGIEVSIGTTLTKNQIPIQPAPSFNLSVHKVTNGTYYANTRKAYRVYDCLKFLIGFMSDNEVGFESDCFNTGGIYSDYCIVNGHELLYFDGTKFPRLNFRSLFSDLKKKFNIRFAIIYSGAIPIIKIEPVNYFFDTSVSYTIPTIPEEVTINADSSLIYSTCRVGSEEYDTTSSLIFPDVSSLISFMEETFYFQGVNNIENELDLVSKIVTSNAIIDICLELYSGYDSYDDSNFLIWYSPSNNKTNNSDWPNTGHHLYNETLNNINVLQRWSSYIPGNAISSFNNTVSNRFKAILTRMQNWHNTPSGFYGPLEFSDDYINGYDQSGSYGGTIIQGNPVTAIQSIYTANASGNYTLTSNLTLRFFFYTSVYQILTNIRFNKYDASNNIIDTFDGPQTNGGAYIFWVNTPNGPQQHVTGHETFLSASWNTFLNSGEYVDVNLYFSDIVVGATITNGEFLSNGLNNGNGIVVATNTKNYKFYKVNFNYPLKLTDFNTIGLSKNGLITIPLNNNRLINAWVDNIKFDNSSGETSFTLISDGNTIYR